MQSLMHFVWIKAMSSLDSTWSLEMLQEAHKQVTATYIADLKHTHTYEPGNKEES